MKFVLSYSFGKDSTLSLHKMIEQGHTPIGLLVMVNENLKRSFFHGVDYDLMQKISTCLDIPLLIGKSDGQDYNVVMEHQLRVANNMGAEVIVFGDIDISDHKTWCEERCEIADVKAVFPLWQKPREEIVNEVIECGYNAIIKTINNEKLDKSFLGRTITPELIDELKADYPEVDVCGEYGEYHTLVVDGPIFKTKLEYEIKEQYDFGVTSVVDIA